MPLPRAPANPFKAAGRPMPAPAAALAADQGTDFPAPPFGEAVRLSGCGEGLAARTPQRDEYRHRRPLDFDGAGARMHRRIGGAQDFRSNRDLSLDAEDDRLPLGYAAPRAQGADPYAWLRQAARGDDVEGAGRADGRPITGWDVAGEDDWHQEPAGYGSAPRKIQHGVPALDEREDAVLTLEGGEVGFVAQVGDAHLPTFLDVDRARGSQSVSPGLRHKARGANDPQFPLPVDPPSTSVDMWLNLSVPANIGIIKA